MSIDLSNIDIDRTEILEIMKKYKLKKKYHRLKNGEFVAIVGPSGCGKSTILNILAGLDTKSSGEIILSDNTKMGYMLQQDALFNWKTVLENCLLGLEINKTLTKENKNYVLDLLNTYGLKDFINSYPNTLSGGMRQRVLRIRYTHK